MSGVYDPEDPFAGDEEGLSDDIDLGDLDALEIVDCWEEDEGEDSGDVSSPEFKQKDPQSVPSEPPIIEKSSKQEVRRRPAPISAFIPTSVPAPVPTRVLATSPVLVRVSESAPSPVPSANPVSASALTSLSVLITSSVLPKREESKKPPGSKLGSSLPEHVFTSPPIGSKSSRSSITSNNSDSAIKSSGPVVDKDSKLSDKKDSVDCNGDKVKINSSSCDRSSREPDKSSYSHKSSKDVEQNGSEKRDKENINLRRDSKDGMDDNSKGKDSIAINPSSDFIKSSQDNSSTKNAASIPHLNSSTRTQRNEKHPNKKIALAKKPKTPAVKITSNDSSDINNKIDTFLKEIATKHPVAESATAPYIMTIMDLPDGPPGVDIDELEGDTSMLRLGHSPGKAEVPTRIDGRLYADYSQIFGSDDKRFSISSERERHQNRSLEIDPEDAFSSRLATKLLWESPPWRMFASDFNRGRSQDDEALRALSRSLSRERITSSRSPRLCESKSRSPVRHPCISPPRSSPGRSSSRPRLSPRRTSPRSRLSPRARSPRSRRSPWSRPKKRSLSPRGRSPERTRRRIQARGRSRSRSSERSLSKPRTLSRRIGRSDSRSRSTSRSKSKSRPRHRNSPVKSRSRSRRRESSPMTRPRSNRCPRSRSPSRKQTCARSSSPPWNEQCRGKSKLLTPDRSSPVRSMQIKTSSPSASLWLHGSNPSTTFLHAPPVISDSDQLEQDMARFIAANMAKTGQTVTALQPSAPPATIVPYQPEPAALPPPLAYPQTVPHPQPVSHSQPVPHPQPVPQPQQVVRPLLPSPPPAPPPPSLTSYFDQGMPGMVPPPVSSRPTQETQASKLSLSSVLEAAVKGARVSPMHDVEEAGLSRLDQEVLNRCKEAVIALSDLYSIGRFVYAPPATLPSSSASQGPFRAWESPLVRMSESQPNVQFTTPTPEQKAELEAVVLAEKAAMHGELAKSLETKFKELGRRKEEKDRKKEEKDRKKEELDRKKEELDRKKEELDRKKEELDRKKEELASALQVPPVPPVPPANAPEKLSDTDLLKQRLASALDENKRMMVMLTSRSSATSKVDAAVQTPGFLICNACQVAKPFAMFKLQPEPENPATSSPSTSTPGPTAIRPAAPTSTPAAPTSTPAAPTSTSAAPTSTSAAPTSTPAAPTSTSAAPTSTSAAPTSTSAAPTSTSAAPTSKSAAPTSTSAAPTSTSAAPTSTSAAPTSTPAAPTSTPAAPTSTPAPPASTTASNNIPASTSSTSVTTLKLPSQLTLPQGQLAPSRSILDKFQFIGDRYVEFVSEFYKQKTSVQLNVFGTPHNVLKRLYGDLTRKQAVAQNAVILAGANDFLGNLNLSFYTCFTNLFGYVRKKSHVLLAVTLPPIPTLIHDERYKREVTMLNQFIRSSRCRKVVVCDAYARYFIAGTNQQKINMELFETDGLYPNRQGIIVLIRAMEEALASASV